MSPSCVRYWESGMIAQALKAVQNGRDPSRKVAFGDPGCEHYSNVVSVKRDSRSRASGKAANQDGLTD